MMGGAGGGIEEPYVRIYIAVRRARLRRKEVQSECGVVCTYGWLVWGGGGL